MRRVVVNFLFGLILYSCVPGTEYETIFSKSYIASYVQIDNIECTRVGADITLYAVINGNTAYTWSTTPDIMEADALRHCDINYNKKICFGPGVMPNALTRPDFKKLQVLGIKTDGSVVDMTSEFMFTAISVQHYIESGYIEKYDWSQDQDADFVRPLFFPECLAPDRPREYWKIHKRMDQLTEKDLLLIGHFLVGIPRVVLSVPLAILSPINSDIFAGVEYIQIDAENVDSANFSCVLTIEH